VLPRERVRIALEGGQPDRVPFLLECDYDYMARAAGREPWEYIYADSLEQARIHEDFYRRHPSDLWKCWGGPSRSWLKCWQIVREQGAVFYLDTRTGRRFEIDRRGGLLDPHGRPITLNRDGEPVDGTAWLASDGCPRAVETEEDIAELLSPAPPPDYWVNGLCSTGPWRPSSSGKCPGCGRGLHWERPGPG